MTSKKTKKVRIPLAYVVWDYSTCDFVDSASFDERSQAEQFVTDGLKGKDFNAEDVVICELVPRCRPIAPVTEVQFEEIK